MALEMALIWYGGRSVFASAIVAGACELGTITVASAAVVPSLHFLVPSVLAPSFGRATHG